MVIDLPEDERIDALNSSFELLSPGGIIIILEPEVPTGDVGELESGKDMSKAQEKVSRFNRWISSVRSFSQDNSLGFVELTGGTLVVLRRSI